MAQEPLAPWLWSDPPPAGSGLAFDGDGTLWSGDVSDDLFFDAIAKELLRQPAVEPLLTLAQATALPELVAEARSAVAKGQPSRAAGLLAAGLFEAYRGALLPERLTYGMMTWCWAGWPYPELVAHARQVLRDAGLRGRAKAPVLEVLREARRRRLFVAVISASPRPILEAALSLLELEVDAVVAATPQTSQGVVLGHLQGEVPYGEAKARAAVALPPGEHWLAAFGDSPFDSELLTLAKNAVVVGDNQTLLCALSGHGALHQWRL